MLRTKGKMHFEETGHVDFSMIPMACSCEYGNASVGLKTNRYISDYLRRFQIDNRLNLKCHIDRILTNLSTVGFVIRQLFYALNLKTLQMAYCAYFHSVIRYGIIFSGNATNSCNVFKLQKRVRCNMSGAEPRASCTGFYRKLEILLVPCQYTLSMVLFILVNPNNFQTGFEIYGLHTRSKNQLFIPIANLTTVQKGITYSGNKIYNSLPSNILNLKNDRKQFKKRYLLNNSFYSVNEFFGVQQ